MKTAKKLLALVLVIVMAVGLTSFAAAKDAAEYKDIASITDPASLEALYVLSGIGVTVGRDDGNFDPAGIFNRAEAAAIIARMLLGANAENLPKSATIFSDVPADFWGSGYIAYCVSKGILVGYGDGKFGPADTVTNAAFCIMLLRALGFGLAGEYTGEGWAMNAYLDAFEKGIFTLDVDFTAAATREQVIVYAFNALQHSEKTVTNTVTEYLVSAAGNKPATDYPAKFIGYTFESVAKVLAEAATAPVSIMLGQDYTVTPVSTTKTTKIGSLADTVFGMNPEYPNDDLGRPGYRVWTYKGVELYRAQVNPPVAVFNKSFTQGDLYKVTNLGANAADSTMSVTWNSAAAQKTATLTSLRNGGKAANDDLKPGVITEIYKVEGVYQAVVIVPSFDVVTVGSKPATAVLGAQATYTIGTIPAKVVFTSHVDAAFEQDEAVISGEVANKDRVLYYQGSKLLYIEAVDTIKGVLTTVRGTVLTIDGQQLSLAGAAFNDPAPDKEEQEFYVDSFGNILGTKTAPPSTDVKIALVISKRETSYLVGTEVVPTFLATIVDAKGVVSTVKISDDTYDDIDEGVVYVYDDSDELYEFDDDLSPVALVGDITKIVRGTPQLTPIAEDVNLASASTLFVAVNYKTASNPDGTVTLYNGISRVPSCGDPTALANTTAISIKVGGTANKVADVVFIYDQIADTSTSKYVFYLGTYTRVVNGLELDVVVDGEDAVMFVTEGSYNTTLGAAANGKGLYTNITVGATGVISSVTKATTTVLPPTTTEVAITELQNIGGLLLDDGEYLATVTDTVPLYIFDMSGPVVDVEVGTAADLDSIELDTGDFAHILTAGGAATAIYVVIH